VASHRRITPAAVRRIVLALPGTTESSHMGHPDFRVHNRIFAGVPADWRAINLKTTPENLDALIAMDSETFRDAWGGRWVGVRLDRVNLPLLRRLIADAWALASPKPRKR
jgi:predicted DNA-binding protein (MmcQ/YjbR family)